MSLAAAQLRARPGRLSEAVDAHVRFAKAAAGVGAKMLVFPELSLTGYSRALTREDALDAADPALQPLVEASRSAGIALMVGAPIAGSNRLQIANFCFRPDGRVVTYTKKHLHDGEQETFEAGHGGALVDVDGARVSIAICAEINHPSHIAAAVADGASVYAASCFLTPRGYPADCRTLEGYSRLHRVVTVMANFTGVSGEFESAGGSAIWDETGTLVARAPDSGEFLLAATNEDGRWSGRLVTAPAP